MTQSTASMSMFVPFTPISAATLNPASTMNISTSGPTVTMTSPMSLPFSSFASEMHGLGIPMPNEPNGQRDSFGLVFPGRQGNTYDNVDGKGNGGHNGQSRFHGGSTGFGGGQTL